MNNLTVKALSGSPLGFVDLAATDVESVSIVGENLKFKTPKTTYTVSGDSARYLRIAQADNALLGGLIDLAGKEEATVTFPEGKCTVRTENPRIMQSKKTGKPFTAYDVIVDGWTQAQLMG